MKKIISTFLFAGLIIFSVQSCGNNEPAKTPVDSTNPQAKVSASVDGKTLYDDKCVVCHGEDGKAGTMGAADLSGSTINHPTVVATIKNGKNAMKAFSPELNDAQIEAVAAYAESLRK
jgi:mono/diheme cytochrome c family protein